MNCYIMTNINKIDDESKHDIRTIAIKQLSDIFTKWCGNCTNNCSGGEMRKQRGDDIELFVRDTINNIGKKLGVNLIAKKGIDDKKELIIYIENKKIKKQHQVDIHIYLNEIFIAVIECKSYLDSCYYVRACDDFRLFKKFEYYVKKYIFVLENSIKDETKIFTDHVNDNICDNVFYILDGKRSSSCPIYNPIFKKEINKINLNIFIDSIYMLCEK